MNHDRMLLTAPLLSSAEIEVLVQCRSAIWDGNIASKSARDNLFKKNLIIRYEGWQSVSEQGLVLLMLLGKLDDRDYPIWNRR